MDRQLTTDRPTPATIAYLAVGGPATTGLSHSPHANDTRVL